MIPDFDYGIEGEYEFRQEYPDIYSDIVIGGDKEEVMKKRRERTQQINELVKNTADIIDRKDKVSVQYRLRWEDMTKLSQVYPHVKKMMADEFKILIDMCCCNAEKLGIQCTELLEVKKKYGKGMRVRQAIKDFVENIEKIGPTMPSELDFVTMLCDKKVKRAEKHSEFIESVMKIINKPFN